jgi:hypothetical protein
MAQELSYILYHDAKEGDRKMTNINNYAFYQSTGTSSGYQNTWFPTLGLGDKTSDTSFYKRDALVSGTGHLIKPNVAYRDIPADVEEKGKTFGLDENFFYRIGNTECLLISTLMNEGYWSTDNGVQFKEYLQEKYKEFYANNADIVFPEKPVQTINSREPGLVNAWLKEKGPLKPIEGITRQLNSEDRKKQFAMRKSPPKAGGIMAGMMNLEQQENKPEPETASVHHAKPHARGRSHTPGIQRRNAKKDLRVEPESPRSKSLPPSLTRTEARKELVERKDPPASKSPPLERQLARRTLLFEDPSLPSGTSHAPATPKQNEDKMDVQSKTPPLERKDARRNLQGLVKDEEHEPPKKKLK